MRPFSQGRSPRRRSSHGGGPVPVRQHHGPCGADDSHRGDGHHLCVSGGCGEPVLGQPIGRSATGGRDWLRLCGAVLLGLGCGRHHDRRHRRDFPQHWRGRPGPCPQASRGRGGDRCCSADAGLARHRGAADATGASGRGRGGDRPACRPLSGDHVAFTHPDVRRPGLLRHAARRWLWGQGDVCHALLRRGADGRGPHPDLRLGAGAGRCRHRPGALPLRAAGPVGLFRDPADGPCGPPPPAHPAQHLAAFHGGGGPGHGHADVHARRELPADHGDVALW